MRQIIPNTLWLGNAVEARDVRAVLRVGVQAIVDLAAEEPVIQLPRDIVYCRFPLIDGNGNPPAVVRAAIETTSRFIQSKVPTLVACGAGMSRSPAIVGAAIANIENIPLEDALRRVTEGQPRDVSPAFLTDVVSLTR